MSCYGNELTYNLQVALSTSHRISVHLTHVPSSINFFDLLYMKIPRTVVVVRQRDPWILRDHVMVDGQDCLCIDAHPCHLKQTNVDTCTKVCLRRRCIFDGKFYYRSFYFINGEIPFSRSKCICKKIIIIIPIFS